MKQLSPPELEARVRKLMSERRYSEAIMECEIADSPAAIALGKTVFPYLTGMAQYEAKLRALGPKRVEMPPPELLRLAGEAMATDDCGFRIGLGRRLLAQAGLADAEMRAEFRKAGDALTAAYLKGRRLRFLESAVKYYAAAGTPEPAFDLVRRIVGRFKTECGFMPLNDALEAIQSELRLSREDVARAVPELRAWFAVYDRLKPTGWFDAAADGKGSEAFSPGDAVFDAFYVSFAGKPVSSFEPVIVAKMEAHFPRRLLFGDKKNVRRKMTRLVRAHGTEAGPYIAGELAKRLFGASRLEPEKKS